MISHELKEKISKVRLLLVDVDGVLTDGRIILGDYGDELKFFDVQDGHGLFMMKRAGFKIIFISGKKSRVNTRRAKDLKVDKVYQNARDKHKVFEQILKKYRVTAHEVCYIGDDLIDIPVLRRAGVAVAVQNAVPEAKEAAHYVTHREGGRGAVREVVDILLKTQDKWTEVTGRYFQ